MLNQKEVQEKSSKYALACYEQMEILHKINQGIASKPQLTGEEVAIIQNNIQLIIALWKEFDDNA